MSAGFVTFYIWRKLRLPRAITPSEKPKAVAQSAQQYVLAGVVLLLLWSGAIYTALPAPDVSYGMGKQLPSHPRLVHTLSKVTGIPEPTPQNISTSEERAGRRVEMENTAG
jgi:hypothetical protein